MTTEVKERTTVDASLDATLFTTEDEDTFLDFIEDRERNLDDLSVPVRNLFVSTDTDSVTGITDGARREATYAVDTDGGLFALRDIAIPSLLERARISGAALGCLSADTFAEIVTKCLQTSKESEETFLRVQDGKVGAFCASTYKIIPQPEIYKTAEEEIDRLFGGLFVNGAYSHRITLAEYTATLPAKGYQTIFIAKGMDFDELKMSIKVATSDTGYSGLNIYPSIRGTDQSGRILRIPILGEIAMPHKGSASLEKFRDNLSLAFAQSEKSLERISELDEIVLNYPFNAFCNVLKKVSISKKLAKRVIDRFAVTTGNKGTASAADLYFQACEIAGDIDESDSLGLMSLEESIAKMLKLNNKSWEELDSSVNCWSFNIIEGV